MNVALSIKERLTAWGYIAGWKLISRLPERVTLPLFYAGADLASKNGKGMEQLRSNLARVVGPENVTRKLVRDSVRSYARYWLEAFRLPRIHNEPGLQDRLRQSVTGVEHLDAHQETGRGLILALPHTGNWDMAGAYLAHNYGAFTTVAERVKPDILFKAFVEFRESLGFEVLPLTGGTTPPYARMREVLQSGGIVCLLAERDLTRSGVTVDFFGEPANFAAGPAKLAQETGAALHVAHSWFTAEPQGWGLSVSEEIPVSSVGETTQRIADAFATNIARHPADWHMLQPQWNADVERRRLARDKERH